MSKSVINYFPLWLRISFVILLGVFIGAYLAGDSTRKLDMQYLDTNMRTEFQNKTNILANIMAESIVTKDYSQAENDIDNFIKEWAEITYLHVQDDRGLLIYEWPGNKIKFDYGTRKFEAKIRFGGVDYGVLSIYVDMEQFYQDMERHITEIQYRSGLILLTTALFIIALVNLMVLEKEE